MNSYITFVKKEFLESVRTFKLWILLLIFIIFGILNPLTAKFTPDIISSLMPEIKEMFTSEPLAIDSWIQFYKNFSTQLIVFIIMFSGIMANEFSKGTLVNILTKGLNRKIVVLAKFTSTSLIWTLSLLIYFGVTQIYTLYLFKGNENLKHIFFAVFCLWVFGVLIISLLLLFGTIFKGNYAALLLTGLSYIILGILSIVPKINKYNPLSLSSNNIALINGELAISDFTYSLIISLILTITCLTLSIFIFNKKEL